MSITYLPLKPTLAEMMASSTECGSYDQLLLAIRASVKGMPGYEDIDMIMIATFDMSLGVPESTYRIVLDGARADVVNELNVSGKNYGHVGWTRGGGPLDLIYSMTRLNPSTVRSSGPAEAQGA